MKTLYHGTSSINLSCIKAIGLVPGHAKGGDAWAKDHHQPVGTLSKRREPSVFVADRAAEAEYFARYAVEEVGGDPIVIKLHVPEPVFATFVVDELFEREKNDTPHAWRAHSVPADCVAEVLPVSPEPPIPFELMQALASLMEHA